MKRVTRKSNEPTRRTIKDTPGPIVTKWPHPQLVSCRFYLVSRKHKDTQHHGKMIQPRRPIGNAGVWYWCHLVEGLSGAGELIKVKARHILDLNTKRSVIATHSQHIHKGDAV